jgi:hypothetical protein
MLQLVNAITPDIQAAGETLPQIARTTLDSVQETAEAFRNSLHSATQNQHTH